jgi:predicted nucleic acid-binding protein
MAHYLLDTDAIIDYLAGVKSTVSLIQELYDRGELLCVSDVVIAEVYSGLRPQDRDKARGLLTACFFLATTPEASQRAGEWRYHYARQGITLATADVLVAATAFAHKAVIVTGNKDHYPMPEVAVLPLRRLKQ